eukprot:gene37975-47275_t
MQRQCWWHGGLLVKTVADVAELMRRRRRRRRPARQPAARMMDGWMLRRRRWCGAPGEPVVL